MKNYKLLILSLGVVLLTGCCVFEKGGWKPLPCSKKEKQSEKHQSVSDSTSVLRQ